jgi:hypothetical protein
MNEKYYTTEFGDRDDLINRTEVAAANIVRRQVTYARGAIRRR